VTRYRTIVADPPWHYDRTGLTFKDADSGEFTGHGLPYGSMTVEEIAAIPVREWAAKDAHLYVWTTQRYLLDTYPIVEAWGFRPSSLLAWCKPSRGFGLGGTFQSNLEFVLFCRRGSLKAMQRVPSQWFQWPRGPHSAKPEAFLDMVESTSPGPRLELFARRARFGWDYWGNESLGTAEVA
jgi:N6-adenosine-specific RNA methylase IME4